LRALARAGGFHNKRQKKMMAAAAIVNGVLKISGYDLLICMCGFWGPIFSVDLSVMNDTETIAPCTPHAYMY